MAINKARSFRTFNKVMKFYLKTHQHTQQLLYLNKCTKYYYIYNIKTHKEMDEARKDRMKVKRQEI